MIIPTPLCSECAKILGGIWPPEHASSWYVSTCRHCNKLTQVTHKRGWTWPTTRDDEKSKEESKEELMNNPFVRDSRTCYIKEREYD
jgi:hypothetical protein